MARPAKQGLDYYTVDVDIYEDDKIQFVSAIFGLEGEGVLHRLLAKIYRSGYYIAWGEDEKKLFAMNLPSGSKGAIEVEAVVTGVVEELFKRGFLDKGMFNEYKILTSSGIQKRYFTSTEKRVCINIDARYWLLKGDKAYTRETMHFYNVSSTENGVITPGNEITGGKKYTKESKGKESKLKESKGKESKGQAGIGEADTQTESPAAASAALPSPNEKKELYGSQLNVYLSRREYESLITGYGKNEIEKKIERLSTNIGKNNPKYMRIKNHYETLLEWCVKDYGEAKRTKECGGSFDVDKFFSAAVAQTESSMSGIRGG